MILVDPAIWPWRGRRWAHLVSDEGYDELHAFAAELGLRRGSFQGDHYDIDEATRVRAVAQGAQPVGSRELLRRLRAAGLRRARSGAPWRWEVVGEVSVGVVSSSAPGSWPAPWPAAAEHLPVGGLERLAAIARVAEGDVALRLLARSGELAAVVARLDADGSLPLAELVVEVAPGQWPQARPSSDERR